VDATAAELAALERDPGAGPVLTRGRTAQAELAESVPKVGAPAVWATGSRGLGKVIVVIDTGVAAGFGGQLVGQACLAADVTGTVGYCGPDGGPAVTEAFDSTCFTLGVCGGGDVLDPLAGRPCSGAQSKCGHGTAVAAVAARHEPTPGVAPDAGVYSIRVFNPDGTGADLFDLHLALEHVLELADHGMAIAAVNLSVATTATFADHCDTGASASDDARAFRTAFAALASRRIGTAVASGNEGRVGSVALPACVSTAVSVGATDLDDQLADFGNRGPGLDLVAPGADEGNGAGNPMDIPGGPITQWAGTSFSAPHVAGALALLVPQYPRASIDQLVGLLRDAGVLVRDPATGSSYPRLRLQAPSQALRAGVLFPTVLPVAGTARSAIGDFDGDGRADVLAHGPGSAPDQISYGRASWTVTRRERAVAGSYLPLVGDFRGSGADDILWYAPGSAADSLWVGATSRSLASVAVSVDGSYFPIVADYDDDGFDDVFWYAPGPGRDSLWFGGSAGFTSTDIEVTGTYRVAAADYNGDGRDDLLFHGPEGDLDSLWLAQPTRGSWIRRPLTLDGRYTLRTGDFDGDGDDDLLLYQPGPDADSIWLGGAPVGAATATGGFTPLPVTVSGTYEPVPGDVDGDGIDDILWYAPGPAGDHLWFGRPSGTPTSRALTATGTYTPLLGDLDASAGDEIVWFSSTATSTPVWWSYEATP
jgi:hypothetical protein